MKRRAFALILVAGLLASLVAVSIALAKGPPQKVTITGGDLPRNVEITDDEATLDALQMMSLEDYDTRSPYEPLEIADYGDNSGEGYMITRYYINSLSGEYFAFDELRYYPAHDGGQGYLRYVGIVNGSSEYDGEWFRPSLAGEATLQLLIADAKGEPKDTPAHMLNVLITRFAALARRL